MTSTTELSAELALLETAARAAGEIALSFFREGATTTAEVSYKEGNSPVSQADHAANTVLETRLRSARPDYGWISEETVDTPHRLGAARTFIVDPIDGTRAFIAGKLDWCVSVALVEHGRPIAGVVHAPSLGQTTTAILGGGAFRNRARLPVLIASPLAGARIAGPPPALDRLEKLAGVPFMRGRRVPSLACRLVQAAAGEVDAAIASDGAHEWDIAAADLILAEAGGVLRDRAGGLLRYNQPGLRQPLLVGGHAALAAELVDLLG
ncbi:MAG: 3'(2'),5'-bisphosphate nucleotidase CysQ [Beijerinckiaceae bacterium]